MKVYMVVGFYVSDPYEPTGVILYGIFSSMDKAKIYKHNIPKNNHSDKIIIKEIEIDKGNCLGEELNG